MKLQMMFASKDQLEKTSLLYDCIHLTSQISLTWEPEYEMMGMKRTWKWHKLPMILDIYNPWMLKIFSATSNSIWVDVEFLWTNNNGNKGMTICHLKKTPLFGNSYYQQEQTIPVLLFLILLGSLSEKLLLHSTSPPGLNYP